MNNADLSQLLDLVNDRLRQTELGRSFDLRVEPELTRVDDAWVYVCVAPHRAGVRAYEFAELLASVEGDVRARAKKAEIVLVPVRVEGTTNGHR